MKLLDARNGTIPYNPHGLLPLFDSISKHMLQMETTFVHEPEE